MAGKSRPGPGGTRIYKKKPRGRARGVPATEAEAAAARMAALKHGGRATLVSVEEARALALERKFGKGSREVIDAYTDAIAKGEILATDFLTIRGLSELELIRRDMASRVADDGSILRDAVVSPATGEIIGERLRLHPGVEGVARFSELLGHTSAARRLDPKSRGEGARDDAVAKMLARDKLLRDSMMKKSLPPPEDDEVLEPEVVR